MAIFLTIGKKQTYYSSAKEGNKQLVSNYNPAPLLPICSKIFEKLILDCTYDFFDQNCLLKTNQSGFRPGDSCIHQLIAVTHNNFTDFDANPSLEVHGIFLDLSNVFDRLWHKGPIQKLKNNGIDDKLLSLIESFLHNRYKNYS